MCCAWAGTLPRITKTATAPLATKQRRKMAHGVSLRLTREYGADWQERQVTVSDLVKQFITWNPRWRRYPRVPRSARPSGRYRRRVPVLGQFPAAAPTRAHELAGAHYCPQDSAGDRVR